MNDCEKCREYERAIRNSVNGTGVMQMLKRLQQEHAASHAVKK